MPVERREQVIAIASGQLLSGNRPREELDEKWKMTKAEHEKDYQRELKRARGGCPDLVEKSSDKPGMEHWDSLYMICLSLFERRNLMLKIQTEDSI